MERLRAVPAARERVVFVASEREEAGREELLAHGRAHVRGGDAEDVAVHFRVVAAAFGVPEVGALAVVEIILDRVARGELAAAAVAAFEGQQ